SVLVLTGDTYLDSLTNEDATNSNIYLNGHKLYVAGAETAANEGTYAGAEETAAEDGTADGSTSSNSTPYVVGGIALAAVAAGAAAVSRKRKATESVASADAAEDGSPEESSSEPDPQAEQE
ncbi:MAG: hypothetical protein IKD97_00815, partial [Firmicutes bacterium]|nr:hypothetical protein [Bacillota bacterium]